MSAAWFLAFADDVLRRMDCDGIAAADVTLRDVGCATDVPHGAVPGLPEVASPRAPFAVPGLPEVASPRAPFAVAAADGSLGAEPGVGAPSGANGCDGVSDHGGAAGRARQGRQLGSGCWYDVPFGGSSDVAMDADGGCGGAVPGIGHAPVVARALATPPVGLCLGRPPDSPGDVAGGGSGISDPDCLSSASSWLRFRATMSMMMILKKAARKCAARVAQPPPPDVPGWPPDVVAAVEARFGALRAPLPALAKLRLADVSQVAAAFEGHAEAHLCGPGVPDCVERWWHGAIAAQPSSRSAACRRFGRLVARTLRQF